MSPTPTSHCGSTRRLLLRLPHHYSRPSILSLLFALSVLIQSVRDSSVKIWRPIKRSDVLTCALVPPEPENDMSAFFQRGEGTQAIRLAVHVIVAVRPHFRYRLKPFPAVSRDLCRTYRWIFTSFKVGIPLCSQQARLIYMILMKRGSFPKKHCTYTEIYQRKLLGFVVEKTVTGEVFLP